MLIFEIRIAITSLSQTR